MRSDKSPLNNIGQKAYKSLFQPEMNPELLTIFCAAYQNWYRSQCYINESNDLKIPPAVNTLWKNATSVMNQYSPKLGIDRNKLNELQGEDSPIAKLMEGT